MPGLTFDTPCRGAHCTGEDLSGWKGSPPPTIRGHSIEDLMAAPLPRRLGEKYGLEEDRFVWFHAEVHARITQDALGIAMGRTGMACRLTIMRLRKAHKVLMETSACVSDPAWLPYKPDPDLATSKSMIVPATPQTQVSQASDSHSQPTEGDSQDDATLSDTDRPPYSSSETSDSAISEQPPINVDFVAPSFNPVNGTQRQRAEAARKRDLKRSQRLEEDARQEEIQRRKEAAVARYRAAEPQRQRSISRRNRELFERDLQEVPPHERQQRISEFKHNSKHGHANLSNVKPRGSEPKEPEEMEEMEEFEE